VEPDHVLWRRASVDGDPDAFTALYDRHADRVATYVARRLGHDRADDVVAEVFLEAWRQRARIVVHEDGGLLPWLVGVARNLVLARYRRDVRDLRLVDRVEPPGVEPDPAQGVADRDEREQLGALARRALASLSEADQAVLELCLLGELTPTEAAPVLGQPASTVRSRLTRARRRLADAYADLSASPEEGER
jgi:RNA polymerase sigma-70 factor (ECF subfamily)